MRRFVPGDALAASNEVAGNYLQTLGTIYAVLLAFTVVVVWQQFNDAQTDRLTRALSAGRGGSSNNPPP